MKKGLVMEGGAMRGLFTAGITDVFMENGIRFDGGIGTSAGAAFGCNYKSGQIGRALRYNKEYCADKRYISMSGLLKTGNLYSSDFCYHEIPDRLDPFDKETYNSSYMRFFVVCTDVHTGQPVYKLLKKADDEMNDYIRASASMPAVSRPVTVDGRTMLDGGISDPIPLRYFEELGYDRNVVILTQPKGYVKKRMRALRFMELLMGKYPKICEALEKRHIVYNDTVKYINGREQSGRLFVIRPEAPLGISRTERDPVKLRNVYNAGRAAAEKALEPLIAYMRENKTT